MTVIGSWEWGNRGVDLYADHLLWFEKETAVRFASGAAHKQSLEDFLRRGPSNDDVPEPIVHAIKRAVGELGDTSRSPTTP